MSHPMLPDPAEYSIHAIEKHPRDHYAIEAWEEFDRGICPCGETVVWSEQGGIWEAAPLRVILLTDEEWEMRQYIGIVDRQVEHQRG